MINQSENWTPEFWARMQAQLAAEEGPRNRARRGEAFAAFLELVAEYGSAKIDCDMESYGRRWSHV